MKVSFWEEGEGGWKKRSMNGLGMLRVGRGWGGRYGLGNGI